MQTLSINALKVKNFVFKHQRLLMLALMIFLCFDGTIAMNATPLGDKIDNGANQLLQEVARVYCGSLAFLLLAIEAAIFLISKNDKAKQGALIAGVGTIIAYIILKVLSSAGGGAIGETIDEVTTWVE